MIADSFAPKIGVLAGLVGLVGIVSLSGCGRNEDGAKPKSGFVTEKVDYRPKITDEMEVLEFPRVDPRVLPETLPVHEFNNSVSRGQAIALVGEIVPYDAGTEGTLIRIELARRVSSQKMDKPIVFAGGPMKDQSGQLSYRHRACSASLRRIRVRTADHRTVGGY